MSVEHDPRVYFAAERTLLAWIRTALSVIGIGFAVARFGLTYFPGEGDAGMPFDPARHWRSHWIGGLMIASGTAMLLLAAWQHVKFTGQLDAVEKPRGYRAIFSVGLALMVAVLAGLMAWVVL